MRKDTPINVTRKLIKISTLEQIQPKGRKTTDTERRKADWFLTIAKICIFPKLKQYKSKTDTLHIKISALEQIQRKGRKTTYTERRKADWFLIIAKICIFLKSKYYKSKTDTLHPLNEYDISPKEHQVVGC